MEDSEVLSWTCCASQIPVLDLAPVATVTSSLPPVLFSSSGLKNCPASSIYEWRILRSYFRPAARPIFLCCILDLLRVQFSCAVYWTCCASKIPVLDIGPVVHPRS